MAAHGKQIVEGDESTHYVSQRRQRRGAPKAIQPPLTPMIDVTFQLLIFFILTSQFRPPEGRIPGFVPTVGQSSAPIVDVTVTIEVLPGGAVDQAGAVFRFKETGEQVGSAKELYDMLYAYKTDDRPDNETSVTIDPDKDVLFGYRMDAYNQALRVGYENVNWAGLDAK